MIRIQKFAAVNVIAALVGIGIPAMAAQDRCDVPGRLQYESVDHRSQHQWNDDRDRRDYDRRDGGFGYRDHRGYGYAYAPAYEAAPVYGGPVYNGGYYDHRGHEARTAAIIGGSAAAGALIGSAAGQGKGAVIGAVIGGIAGAAASSAADHHHRY